MRLACRNRLGHQITERVQLPPTTVKTSNPMANALVMEALSENEHFQGWKGAAGR